MAGADQSAAARRATKRAARGPHNHRTVDRVTRILEEVVYNPGIGFTDLVRSLGAAKSSVHGFIGGLLANGWLYEERRGFYLGPAVYGLTLASGHIRAGSVTHEDLAALHKETGQTVFLGVQAGEHLIYVDEAGADEIAGFEARSNIRRALLATAGGRALLAAQPEAKRDAYLRRRRAEESEVVEGFLAACEEIRRTRVATNLRLGGTRFAIATAIRNASGEPIAAVTLVGPADRMTPRVQELSAVLLRHVDAWPDRSIQPREAI
jgi:DNA-binding IclR family transcriptional regulator